MVGIGVWVRLSVRVTVTIREAGLHRGHHPPAARHCQLDLDRVRTRVRVGIMRLRVRVRVMLRPRLRLRVRGRGRGRCSSNFRVS